MAELKPATFVHEFEPSIYIETVHLKLADISPEHTSWLWINAKLQSPITSTLQVYTLF